jgi:hypothetical protein
LNCHNRRLKAYLLVLASAGTRALETCAIRLRDIDFSTRPTKIHIRKEYAKTRVSRDIYISDESTKYLKDWICFKYRMASNNSYDDAIMSINEVRAATYREKCMKYLTFLDYSMLEAAEKRVEAQLAQKDKEIEIMKEQFDLLRERQKQRENDFVKLKSVVEFLKDKINAGVIAEPSSKVISDEKGIPKAIKASTIAGTAMGEIDTATTSVGE